MAITIQHKRDTAANWTSNNPTLAAGEFGFETDTGKFKAGDGSTAWSSLGYFETAAPSGPSSTQAQGSTSGYASSGGGTPIYSGNIINKYPFSADSNATDVGDLTTCRCFAAGQSSSASGYVAGGYYGPSPGCMNIIDKFPFSTDANATDVGDLTSSKYGLAGQSSTDNGYVSGGYGTDFMNVIEKFPFSADSNASDVGDLTGCKYTAAGQSSSTHGYVSGGLFGSPYVTLNVIEKFSFSVDGNGSDVGDLVVCTYTNAGQNSSTHGYTSGGQQFSQIYQNAIQKFPFSSDSNATDVGDLLCAAMEVAGNSSTSSGYTVGGRVNDPGAPETNVIQKFPFSSDSDATDVGDLTETRFFMTGQQV